MNRQEEYWTLIQALNDPPAALDGTAERAKARARRQRAGKRWGLSLGSLAGVCAAFVVAVNALPSFALACSNVPVLRELAAAVSLSPSLTAALEHDYVQYVGQTQTGGGVTLTLEYIIADEQQMVVFYRAEGDCPDYVLTCGLRDENGAELGGYSVTGSGPGEGGLDQFAVHFVELEPPENLTLDLFLWESREHDTGNQVDHTFSFPISLDPAKTAQPITLPVDRWVELDGQRLLVDRLELTPTRTTLYLDEDPANTAWLRNLSFYFTDGAGSLYENIDGSLGATGRGGTEGFYTYFFQSLYFVEDKERLTLHIDQAVWLDKSMPTVRVDLTDGSVEGTLPEDVTGVSVTRENIAGLGQQTMLWVDSRTNRAPFSSAYWDPEGGEHASRGFGMSSDYTDRQGVYHPFRHDLILEDYHWDTVELKLNYTGVTKPESPLSIPLA